MNLKYNNNFTSLIGGKFSLESVNYCSAAGYVTKESFVLIDGCYYLKTYAPKGKYHNKGALVDRTGNECSYNELFLDDLLDKPLNPYKNFCVVYRWQKNYITNSKISTLMNLSISFYLITMKIVM